MKLIQKILLYSLVFMFLSCGDDTEEMKKDEDGGSTTEITISADKLEVKPNRERITLTAVDQDGEDLSDDDDVIYFANQTRIPRVFTLTSEGTFTIFARKGSIKSNELEVESGIGEITALNIQTDKSSIPANGFSVIALSATDQDQDMITSFVDFYANDQKLESNYFYSWSEGSVELKAKYEEVESDPVSAQVTPSNSKGRKILIEEFTGEWCGWCPVAGYNCGLLASRSDAVIMTAIHGGQGADRYKYTHEGTLSSALKVSGFPDALINRNKVPQSGSIQAPTIEHPDFSPIIRQIEDIIEETTQLGIAVKTELSGSEVTITPKIKFYESISNPVRYTIYINENKLNGSGQANYYSGEARWRESIFYNLPSTLTDYEHDHVLRKNATDALGDLIPASSVVANEIYEPKPISVDLSPYVIENCEIVVFAHYDINGSDKAILNAQKVVPGESIDYTGLPFK